MPPAQTSVDGAWNLDIATPIGRLNAVLELRTQDGVLRGTAKGAGEDVELTDVRLEGSQLTWSQAITKPLRLNLKFAMDVDGDTMTGTSKAGRLPASKVTGTRAASGAL
jgi:hypothetical protein